MQAKIVILLGNRNSFLQNIQKLGKRYDNTGKIVVSQNTLSSPLLIMRTGIVQNILNQKNTSIKQNEELKNLDAYITKLNSKRSSKRSSKRLSKNNIVPESSEDNSFDPSDDIEESLSNTVEINIKIRSESRRRRTSVRYKGKI